MTAHNAADDSQLQISMEADFSWLPNANYKTLIFFTALDNGEVDSVEVQDDGRRQSDVNELRFEVDPSLLDSTGELDESSVDSIQLVGEVIYGEELPDYATLWKGDIKIGDGSSCFVTDANGNIGQLDRDSNFGKYTGSNRGMKGGIEPDKLSQNTLALITNSGGGAAGGGLKVIDKLIDSLDPTPLEANAMYLIAPDEATTDNNVLTLPDGQAGDIVIVLDADAKFDSFPTVVQSDKKIDGYDTITMDMAHCYMEFIFSERRDSWVTRDPLFAPISLHSRIKR